MEGSLTEFFAHVEGCHQARHLRILHSPQADSETPLVRQLEICSVFMDTIALTTASHRAGWWGFPKYSDKSVLLDHPFLETDNFLEHTYGITPSIASMIYLTNKIWLYTQARTNHEVLSPSEVKDSLQNLAEQLETWSSVQEVYTSMVPDDQSNILLVKALSTAFCSAAQIYFVSCFTIDSTCDDFETLDVLSELTLTKLEEAEQIKFSTSNMGAALSWPAFVAACESPPHLHKRWTEYWEKLLQHRIGSQQVAWEVVQMVWKKDTEENDPKLSTSESLPLATSCLYTVTEPSWASVIRDNGITVVAM